MATVAEKKCPSFNFFFVNVKGNWIHLVEKNSQPEAKITTIFRIYNIMKIF